jgi:hypothetical protein
MRFTFLMDTRKQSTRLLTAVWPRTWLIEHARVGTDISTFVRFHVGR